MTQAMNPIEYRDGTVTCKGQLVLPAGTDRRPGVVVFPDISGVSEHPIGRANRLAEEFGYIALVADVYGEGKAPPFPEAMEVVASWLLRPDDLARRAGAALNALKAHSRCNGRLSAIGFCFGGATVLALARSGSADLRAGASFHGVLATPKPAVLGVVKAKLLVLHGAEDPGAGEAAFRGQGDIKSKTVLEFTHEMSNAGVDCQTISYSGVVHGFTIPDAEKFGMPAVMRYDPVADRRSWQAMATFFQEAL